MEIAVGISMLSYSQIVRCLFDFCTLVKRVCSLLAVKVKNLHVFKLLPFLLL